MDPSCDPLDCTCTFQCMDYPETWHYLGSWMYVVLMYLVVLALLVFAYAWMEIKNRMREEMNEAKAILFLTTTAVGFVALATTSGIICVALDSYFIAKHDRLKDFVAYRVPQTLIVCASLLLTIFWRKAFLAFQMQAPFIQGRKSVFAAILILCILQFTLPYVTSEYGNVPSARVCDVIMAFYILSIGTYSFFAGRSFSIVMKGRGHSPIFDDPRIMHFIRHFKLSYILILVFSIELIVSVLWLLTTKHTPEKRLTFWALIGSGELFIAGSFVHAINRKGGGSKTKNPQANIPRKPRPMSTATDIRSMDSRSTIHSVESVPSTRELSAAIDFAVNAPLPTPKRLKTPMDKGVSNTALI